jgi:hypothetical protein
MTNEITSPLASIVARMAEKRVIGGRAEKLRGRFQQCTDTVAVLCDVSGSMKSMVASSHASKFDHMKIALEDVLKGYPGIKLVAFGSGVRAFTSSSELPKCGELGDSTDLAAAILSVKALHPRKTIVISDGLPDDQARALAAASEITGSIDTIYCGWDGDPGVKFLQRLSRDSGGVQVTWDGVQKELGTVVRGLLPAPACV